MRRNIVMTDTEKQKCNEIARKLKWTIFLGFVVTIGFITIFVFRNRLNNDSYSYEMLLWSLYMITGILCFIRLFHLTLDAYLFSQLSQEKMSLNDVNELIKKWFGKNVSNKSVDDRIKGTEKLIKGFYIVLMIHFMSFIILNI